MSDEIKEILDKLQKHINHEKFANYTTYELRVLLDYITNLQTIEREYSSLLSENAELQQKYDKALSDLVKESHKRIKGE